MRPPRRCSLSWSSSATPRSSSPWRSPSFAPVSMPRDSIPKDCSSSRTHRSLRRSPSPTPNSRCCAGTSPRCSTRNPWCAPDPRRRCTKCALPRAISTCCCACLPVTAHAGPPPRAARCARSSSRSVPCVMAMCSSPICMSRSRPWALRIAQRSNLCVSDLPTSARTPAPDCCAGSIRTACGPGWSIGWRNCAWVPRAARARARQSRPRWRAI